MNSLIKKSAAFISAVAMANTALADGISETLRTHSADKVSYRTTYPIFGDLNDDKRIDSFDVALMRQVIAKKEYNRMADLNGDKKNDKADLLLLNNYVLGKFSFFDAIYSVDADEDSICDAAEVAVFKTDPDSKDTDGDGLTDFEEVMYTASSPVISDSITKGVLDSKADTDDDGISNIDELKIGSDPNNADTDGDGLSDGEEYNSLKTNCLKADTDGDGITDYEEEKLGLDPLNKATDGTPDNKRIVKQTISSDSPILNEINTEENAYSLSIVINASGYAPNCLKAAPSSYAYILKNGSAVGETPEFAYDKNFDVQSITFRFEIKEPFIDNVSHYFDDIDGDYYSYEYEVDPELDGIKRLNVFRYFTSVGAAVPMATEYDEENNTVSVTISKFEKDEDDTVFRIGSYSLVDLEVWMKLINETTPELIAPQAAPSFATEIKLPAEKKASIKKTLKELADDIISLITSNYQSYVKKENKKITQKPLRNIMTMSGHRYAYFDSKSISWASANANCYSMGGHLMTINSPMELNFLNNALSRSRSGGLYWVGGRGGSGNWSWITGESMSYARTITVSKYTMDDCEDYFSYLGNCLAYCPRLAYMSNGYPSYSKIRGYICEWEPGAVVNIPEESMYTIYSGSGAPIILDEEPSGSGKADSDDDGIKDWDEIDHEIIKMLGGSSSDTCVKMADIVKYLKAKQLIEENWDEKFNKAVDHLEILSKQVTPLSTSPDDPDTDSDGLEDNNDASISNKYSDIFEVTSGFVNISTNDYIDIAQKESDKTYNTTILEPINLNTIGIQLRTKLDLIIGKKCAPTAEKFLEHFLDNTGKPYNFDAEEVVTTTYTGANNFAANVNKIMEYCEYNVKDHLTFRTRSDVGYSTFPATKFSENCISKESGAQNLDWWFSIGNSTAAASVSCVRNGDEYTADIKYYILDFYDWNKFCLSFKECMLALLPGGIVFDGEMGELHKMGKAREFKVVGTYKKSLTWKKGQRLVAEDIDPNGQMIIELI